MDTNVSEHANATAPLSAEGGDLGHTGGPGGGALVKLATAAARRRAGAQNWAPAGLGRGTQPSPLSCSVTSYNR